MKVEGNVVLRWRSLWIVWCSLTGCSAGGAPSYVLFGAYFPSWLLFALVWGMLAMATWLILVVAGQAPTWPWPLAFCLAAGGMLAIAVWYLLTGTLP